MDNKDMNQNPVQKEQKSFDKNNKKNSSRPQRRRRERQPKLYDEEVITITRVTKVTKGGRHFRF